MKEDNKLYILMRGKANLQNDEPYVTGKVQFIGIYRDLMQLRLEYIRLQLKIESQYAEGKRLFDHKAVYMKDDSYEQIMVYAYDCDTKEWDYNVSMLEIMDQILHKNI